MKNTLRSNILTICFLLIAISVLKINTSFLKVSGKVIIIDGNNMPINLREEKFISDIIVLAVKGKVKTIAGQKRIPIKKISFKKYKSKTNKFGEFLLYLPPGKYTFFIKKDNSAYLNDFNGQGIFQQKSIDKNRKDLILIDDSNSLF
mgnify:CR=1 FL=1